MMKLFCWIFGGLMLVGGSAFGILQVGMTREVDRVNSHIQEQVETEREAEARMRETCVVVNGIEGDIDEIRTDQREIRNDQKIMRDEMRKSFDEILRKLP